MIGFVVLQQIWSPFLRMLIQRKEDSEHKIEDYAVYRRRDWGKHGVSRVQGLLGGSGGHSKQIMNGAN